MRAEPVEAAVNRWLAEFSPGGPVLVAVSGGADSLALAAAVIAVRPTAAAITVDHGLQDGSAVQAKRCAEQLRGLGFDRIKIQQVAVATGNAAGGLEAAARSVRYAALKAFAVDVGAGIPVPVLLGHTLDDQAETVLLGLSRGSGPRSIAGMRPWRSPWGRPLLAVRRSDTERACIAAGLTPWWDPHNEDAQFARVRLRREVLPLLEETLSGGVVLALARTADLLGDDLDALDELAKDLLDRITESDRTSVPVKELLLAPRGLRRRVLRSWLAGQGISGLTFDLLHRLDALMTARTGAAVRLGGGRDVTRLATALELESPSFAGHDSAKVDSGG